MVVGPPLGFFYGRIRRSSQNPNHRRRRPSRSRGNERRKMLPSRVFRSRRPTTNAAIFAGTKQCEWLDAIEPLQQRWRKGLTMLAVCLVGGPPDGRRSMNIIRG
ncbi:hypothetical protein EJB05_18472, partial [Eragrostis curvula]